MSFKERIRRRLRTFLGVDAFPHLRRRAFALADYRELLRYFRWELDPILDDPEVYAYRSVEDLNGRRFHDAESLATVVRNLQPSACLDIGTARGHSAALMALNAPQATVATVNIPPEEFAQGGTFTTMKLAREEIGEYYRGRNLTNIRQIYANTATWEPDFGPLDVAYIDGSHDTWFVINDTLKVLPHMKPGGFVLWHDFNPAFIERNAWMRDVCLAVEELYARGTLHGPVFYLRDAWVGIYQVQKEDTCRTPA